METIGVIPARLGSTRLKGKVLADLCGKPVIQHVYERARKARLLDDVIIACDDEQIMDVVREFGGNAVLTSKDHATGTDRLAEVVNDIDVKIVVNIQGDEPLVNPMTIDDLVSLMQKDPKNAMGTVVKKSVSAEEFRSPTWSKPSWIPISTCCIFRVLRYPPFSRKGTYFTSTSAYTRSPKIFFLFSRSFRIRIWSATSGSSSSARSKTVTASRRSKQNLKRWVSTRPRIWRGPSGS